MKGMAGITAGLRNPCMHPEVCRVLKSPGPRSVDDSWSTRTGTLKHWAALTGIFRLLHLGRFVGPCWHPLSRLCLDPLGQSLIDGDEPVGICQQGR